METIKLKQKKKKSIKWKNFLIFLIILFFILLFFWIKYSFHFAYEYYIIDDNQNKIILGTSSDKNLINMTVWQYTDTIKEEGYAISDFNLKTVIKKKKVIISKNHIDKTEEIKNKIKEEIYIYVCAEKLIIEETIIYIPYKKLNSTINKITEANKTLNIEKDYEYVNIKNIWTDDEINDYILSITKVNTNTKKK